MSRDIPGVYTLPAGSAVANGDSAVADDLNVPLNDIAADLNVPRPVVAGGTGASSAAAALVNLGLTATAAEINVLDGVTASTAELNILDGVTAAAAELNILDGVTASTAELNFVDGVTSAIQTQLDAKQASGADLAAIEALGSTGIAVRTAANTWAQRTITSTDTSVSITNPGGVAGNIDLSVSASGMTLLGTISTSSGATVTLGSLVLTSYKQMVLVINNVSTSGGGGFLQMGAGGVQFTVGGAAADFFCGIVVIDLATSIFSSVVATLLPAGTSATNGMYAGIAPWNNATTSITFDSSSGNFDNGSIVVYGVT